MWSGSQEQILPFLAVVVTLNFKRLNLAFLSRIKTSSFFLKGAILEMSYSWVVALGRKVGPAHQPKASVSDDPGLRHNYQLCDTLHL